MKAKISIVSYSMRAWVAKTGGTLLRQEKTLKGRLALPDTGEVEFTTHGVQNYRRYGEVELTIPEAAKQILVPESFQLSAYSIEDGHRVWWVRGPLIGFLMLLPPGMCSCWRASLVGASTSAAR
jgi:hypothetical protein